MIQGALVAASNSSTCSLTRPVSENMCTHYNSYNLISGTRQSVWTGINVPERKLDQLELNLRKMGVKFWFYALHYFAEFENHSLYARLCECEVVLRTVHCNAQTCENGNTISNLPEANWVDTEKTMTDLDPV